MRCHIIASLHHFHIASLNSFVFSAKIVRFQTQTVSTKPPVNPEQQKAHHGDVHHAFYAPEFLDYERGMVWYAVAGGISLLIIAVGILNQAITFVIAYLLAMAVYFLLHHREARLLEVAITTYGIRIDGEFFPYNEIRNFWVIWDPPYVADLKITVHRRLHPIRTIHIFGQDPEHLRQLLSSHITEATDRGESHTSTLIRMLRL